MRLRTTGVRRCWWAALPLVLATSCSSAAVPQAATNSAPSAPVPSQTTPSTLVGNDGVAAPDIPLPDSWPERLPLPEGGVLWQVQNREDETGRNVTMHLFALDGQSPRTVSANYRSQLVIAGLGAEVLKDGEDANGWYLAEFRTDGATVIRIARSASGTTVMVATPAK